MVPRKKPRANPETENESDVEVSQDITIGSKDLNVKLSLNGRGIVLIYALAFSIVFGTIGWVVFQIITALKITGGSVGQSLGFVLWSLIACLCAFLLR